MKIGFVSRLAKSYGARPKLLTGNAQSDLQDINNWVQQQTKGKIVKFLKEIPTGISIFLIGAAYFKGKSLLSFMAGETRGLLFACQKTQEGRSISG